MNRIIYSNIDDIFHAPAEFTIWSRDKFQNGYFYI